MYSNLVPFDRILSDVKDETGIENIRNLRPKIRRLVYRIERDLGFGGTVILKRIKMTMENGLLIKLGNTIRAKLPDDLLFLEAIGMCSEGICPGDYRVQGNYLFFCKGHSLTEFNLLYYTLLVDGEGNPVVTENHQEAITAGITYYLYKAKGFQDKGSMQRLMHYEQYFFRELRAAIGRDVMPSTSAEWSKIATIMSYSSRDAVMYLSDKKCFCSIEESGIEDLYESGNNGPVDNGSGGGTSTTSDTLINYFQFDNYIDTIAQNAIVTDQWLLDNATLLTEASLIEGRSLSYDQIGRIGFAIKTTVENLYTFLDILGNVLNDTVFDKVYDPVRGLDIYISKEFYTPQELYIKFKKN